MKNNKKINIISTITTIIFFSIMISSTLLFRNLFEVGGGSSQIKLTEGLIANEYYSSKSFDEYLIPSISKSLEIAVSSQNSYKSLERARLDSINNMKFLAINKYTGEVYSNTDYKTEKEFRQYMEDYCNIQIINGGRGYIKNIGDNKVINYNLDNNGIDVSSKHIYVYLSFPKIITESDEVYESYYYYQKYKFMAQAALLVMMISVLLFCLMVAILTKNKLFINKYKIEIPIEFEIIILILSGVFLIENLKFITFYKAVIVTLNITVDTIMILGIMEKCQSCKGIINTLERCFVIQQTNKVVIQFKLLTKDVLLSKKVLVVGITATIFNILGYFLDIVFSTIIFTFVISTLSIISITVYLILKLSYLNHIMNSANKIRKGSYDYKVKIKGNDNFAQLAENINNLGEIQERVVEDKLLSEKVKLKLIYNTGLSIKNNIESLSIDSDVLNVHLDELLELSNQNDASVEVINTDLINIINKNIDKKRNENINSNLEVIFNTINERVFIAYTESSINKILDKILDNVYKYSLDNTRVYIDLGKEDEKVKLVIKNISSTKISFNNDSDISIDDKPVMEIMNSNSITLLDISYLIKNKGGYMKIDTDGDLFKLSIVF